jgi:trigger factor
MKSAVESISSIQTRVTVSLSSDVVDSKFASSYKEWQKKANVQGFRKGKAPLHIVKKIYNEQVTQDVKVSLIEDSLFKALEEHRVNPISRPVLENAELFPQSGVNYEFSAIVEVFPKIDLDKGLRDLKIEIAENRFDLESTFTNKMNELVKKFSTKVTPEDGQEISKGNLVEIIQSASCEGKADESFAYEGEVEVCAEKTSIRLEVKDALVGMKIGEKKQIIIKSESLDKDLVAKEVTVDLEVRSFMVIEEPKIDDELAKSCEFENLEEMQKKLRSFLIAENSKIYENLKEEKVFEKIRNNLNFDAPEVIVNNLIDSSIKKMFGSSKDLESSLKNEKYREILRPNAENTAKNTIIIGEIIKTSKLEVTSEELYNHVSAILSAEGKEASDKKVKDFIKNSGSKGSLDEEILFSKAVKEVVAKAEFVERDNL